MQEAQTKGKESIHSIPFKKEDLQTLYTKEILPKEYRKKAGANNRKAN